MPSKSLSRPDRRFACLAAALLRRLRSAEAPQKSAASAADAQVDVPWLYENSDVPPDPRMDLRRTGQRPALCRAAQRGATRAGFDPHQGRCGLALRGGRRGGYAHLLEHLLFRQSKYLADGEAIANLAAAGRELSAATPMPKPRHAAHLQARPAQCDAGLARRDLQAAVRHGDRPDAQRGQRALPTCRSCWPKCASAAARPSACRMPCSRRFYEGQPLAERLAHRHDRIAQGANQRKACARSIRAGIGRRTSPWWRR
jgi:zinc protease